MNNSIFLNIFRFIGLILAQVAIFNHINFLGYLNPYIYILFLVYYPFDKDQRVTFLFSSFLLGLAIDFFGDSGGVHAAACVTVAFLRPVLMRATFGQSFDFNTLKLNKTTFGQRFNFITLLILTHHLLLFVLEIFSFAQWGSIVGRTLATTLFTLILCLIFITLFSRKRT